jgi:alkanesulfonate monooxygenase SsuD/methylene tetrahydromethanopterin reductase-like flavin-dependent oxidoreductase (luciferase family)
VRVGVTLPTFREDTSAVDAAVVAEGLGFDGVFVFDHLWPIGRPDRPALSAMPLLGAVAATTERVAVGSLVARIGLLPDDVLVASLLSLQRISAGRFIAGLGVGDQMSAQENLAFGIPYAPREERLASLKTSASRLLESGTTVWVGGRGRTIEIARDVGAVVNLWGAGPDELASVRADYSTEVTWGGTPGRDNGNASRPTVSEIADQLTEMGLAGATWAVCTWPAAGISPEELSEAVVEVRKRLDVVPGPLTEKGSEASR